jgi:hypothetical protein
LISFSKRTLGLIYIKCGELISLGLGSIKCGELVDKLLKKDSAPCSELVGWAVGYCIRLTT